jgi:hypothetical protein
MAHEAPEAPKTHHGMGDQFLRMVGLCILEWAKVDDALFEIFRRCVGPYEQSAIIYYRADGLNYRFDLTDELVRSVLPKRVRKSGGHDHQSVKAWEAAKLDYHGLLGIRRRIAHHPLVVRSVPTGRGWNTTAHNTLALQGYHFLTHGSRFT